MENWFNSVERSAAEEGERWKPLVLSNKMADLAVAYGAAYYGLVRQGKGVFIRGGIGRSYYIGLGSAKKENAKSIRTSVQALCVVPRKMEEGQEVEIKDKEFTLLIGEPVSFPLYDSSSRLLDQAGDILPVDEQTEGGTIYVIASDKPQQNWEMLYGQYTQLRENRKRQEAVQQFLDELETVSNRQEAGIEVQKFVLKKQ